MPFNLGLFECWPYDALRKVVQDNRMIFSSGQNGAPKWRAVRIPKIEKDLSQFIIDGDKSLALFRLSRSYFTVPHRPIDGDMFLRTIPFFPAHPSSFARTHTAKCHDADRGARQRLPFE